MVTVLPIDAWSDRQVERMRGNRALDRIMYGASALGDDGRVWIAAAALRARSGPDPWRRFARQMTWLTIESIVVNGPAKGAVRRQRPPHIDRVHPHHLRRPSNSSFPSGHAASAATMAMLLSEDGLAPLWWGLALTIAASRVYVGVHHPSDVAAGLAAGTAMGYLARKVTLPWVEPQRPAEA